MIAFTGVVQIVVHPSPEEGMLESGDNAALELADAESGGEVESPVDAFHDMVFPRLLQSRHRAENACHLCWESQSVLQAERAAEHARLHKAERCISTRYIDCHVRFVWSAQHNPERFV